MQLPSASSERLMLAPSFMRRPWLLVADARSEPARSMTLSDALHRSSTVPAVRGRRVTLICSTAWLRLLAALASVGLCVRRWLPSVIISSTCSGDAGVCSVMPTTEILRAASSRSARPGPGGVGSGESRSRMVSL